MRPCLCAIALAVLGAAGPLRSTAAPAALVGFRIKDVRYMLATHAHLDHAGGVARVQKDSGAVVPRHPAHTASRREQHVVEARLTGALAACRRRLVSRVCGPGRRKAG